MPLSLLEFQIKAVEEGKYRSSLAYRFFARCAVVPARYMALAERVDMPACGQKEESACRVAGALFICNDMRVTRSCG